MLFFLYVKNTKSQVIFIYIFLMIFLTTPMSWKESEGSSLPDEVRENPEYGDGILVKVTREKVKLYHLGGRKSFCTRLPYSAAMQLILG